MSSAPAPAAPRRWLAHPVLSVLLAAGWLLLQGSLAPAALLWAAVFGLGLPWLLHGFLQPGQPLRRPAVALRLAGVVLLDIVLANLAVARIVLDPRRTPQPAWLVVPSGLRDPRGLALLATIVTNTPGTVSCVVDEERRSLLVHALDAPDPQAVVREIANRYDAPLQEIFG
jgi:multicomponent K+:H+ antiporter subunit E